MYKLLITLLLVSTACSAEFSTTACTDKMIKEHGVRVRAEITANVKYPALAIRKEITGSGAGYFEFSNEDTKPTNIQIIKSTGSALLDKAITDAIKISDLPVTLCDMGGRHFNIYIPVKFQFYEPKVEKPKNKPRPNPIPLHESPA